MKKYQYIIIGGGMTGSAAVMGIRENDPDGTVAMFSEEPFQPYNRPPLSKSLWKGKAIDDIIRPMGKYNIDLYLETRIEKISPESKTVNDFQGQSYQYEKLLLATGGHPIRLPDSPEGVIYYRTRKDYQNLKALTEAKDNFCVVGGGFIGSEITAALINNEKAVTMIFPDKGISGNLFPDDLAQFLNQYYEEKGVSVLSRNLVESISKVGDQYEVRYKASGTNEVLQASFDGVIVGIGIKPNVALAENAGIKVQDGIVVNEFLQTNQPDIFAAGDVTQFFHLGLGKMTRVEHEDNANKMGLAAGINMSAEMKKYENFPFFYSDLFDLGYEAIGEIDKDLNIIEDWIEPYQKGTIFYLQKNKVRGIIFWNLWGQVDKGKVIISKGKDYKASDLQSLFSED